LIRYLRVSTKEVTTAIDGEIFLSLAALLRLRVCVCLIWVYIYIHVYWRWVNYTFLYFLVYLREKRPITTHAHVNKLVDDQIVKKKEMTFFYFFLLHFLFDKQKVEDPISRPYTHTPSFDVKKKEIQRKHWTFYVILYIWI